MKKIVLVLLIVFLCGCSNKLTCTYEEKYEDVKIKYKIVFDFKKNEYTSIDKMIFKDNNKASDYYEEIKEYKNEYNLSLDNKVITSRMSDTIKLDGDKNKIKEQYEGYDYKCK